MCIHIYIWVTFLEFTILASRFRALTGTGVAIHIHSFVVFVNTWVVLLAPTVFIFKIVTHQALFLATLLCAVCRAL